MVSESDVRSGRSAGGSGEQARVTRSTSTPSSHITGNASEQAASTASKTLASDAPIRAGGAGLDKQQISFDDYARALELERAAADERLSLYVHLPFCPSRCLTCDHQTSVSHDGREIDRYLDAMEREIALVAEHLGAGRKLQQLHLGGGTPNYLTDLQLVRLIDLVDRYFAIDDNTETSLEANAHRASMSQLSLLHGLGFRAINLELRDLDAGVQQALGRRQSLPVVRDVMESARSVGFERISADLVYGLPQQSVASIRGTVDRLVELDPDRISCHTYSRQPQLFQHQHAVDQGQLPSLADKVGIFSRIVDGLSEAGYEWIGLDCFARDDDKITRAHKAGTLHRNWIGYTDSAGPSLVGLGSSATSDLSTICVRNQISIDNWHSALERDELPVEHGTHLSAEQRERRRALSDLMCNLQHSSSGPFDAANDPTLRALQEDGFVEIDAGGVSVTETGRYALHQLWGDASPSYRWGSLL